MFGLPSLFRPKPAHTAVRYVHGTRAELTRAQREQQARKASIVAQLAVYAATTSLEERRKEADAFFAAKRLTREPGR